jgi:hypothetical protein
MVMAHMKAPLTKKTIGSMKASPIAQMERIKSVEIGNEKAKILMAKPDFLCLQEQHVGQRVIMSAD